jgi:NTE family protein
VPAGGPLARARRQLPAVPPDQSLCHVNTARSAHGCRPRLAVVNRSQDSAAIRTSDRTSKTITINVLSHEPEPNSGVARRCDVGWTTWHSATYHRFVGSPGENRGAVVEPQPPHITLSGPEPQPPHITGPEPEPPHITLPDPGLVPQPPVLRPVPRPGLVLSGGGTHGDFEVGAVRFLSDSGRLQNLGLIAGTSVGAISALKLAEGGTTALAGLEDLWLGLQTDDDMYLPEAWYNNVQEVLRQAGKQLTALNVFDILSSPAGWSNLLDDTILGGSAATALAGAVDAVSLFNLTPLQTLIQSNVDPNKIAASGIALYMGVVCLEDGSVNYITGGTAGPQGSFVTAEAPGTLASAQIGNLVPSQIITTDPAGTLNAISPGPVDLRTGALASASKPLAFPPVTISGVTFVDAGIREAEPIAPALAGGSSPLYVVVASQRNVSIPYTNPFTDTTLYSFTNAMLPDICLRTAMDILPQAAQELPLAPLEYTTVLTSYSPATAGESGASGPINATIIQPTFSPHDVMTIDPGLISISMAYGYMRAAEAVSNTLDKLWTISDQITRLRLEIWNLENSANGQPQVPDSDIEPVPVPSALEQVRSAKLGLRNVVCGYQALGGIVPPSDFRLPNEFVSSPALSSPGTDFSAWWQQWERHNYEPVSLTPWDEFVTPTGNVPQTAPPPANCAGVPQPPPL